MHWLIFCCCCCLLCSGSRPSCRPSPISSHLKFRFLYGFYFYKKDLTDKKVCFLIIRPVSYFFNIVLAVFSQFQKFKFRSNYNWFNCQYLIYTFSGLDFKTNNVQIYVWWFGFICLFFNRLDKIRMWKWYIRDQSLILQEKCRKILTLRKTVICP